MAADDRHDGDCGASLRRYGQHRLWIGHRRFFNPGTTNGAAARATLDAAADFFSDLLTDTLEGIQTPDPYESQVYDTVVTWYWTMNFTHPTTGAPHEVMDETVAANEYLIFAGARSLTGNTLGIGGPGGYSAGSQVSGSGNVTPSESDEIDAITTEFFDDVDTRGETSGFSRWGGVLTFDTSGPVWNYDHTKPPVSGQADLFSVAVHEMGHALGLGGSDAWNDLVTGGNFTGPVSMSEYGGPVPLNAQNDHWAEGTMSTVVGTSIPQEASMDPSLTQHKRKYFTYLDAAALDDIGWSLSLPDPVPPGDYNQDGKVSAADYTIWRDTLGSTGDLRANGDGDNSIDFGDFTVWKNNYGATGGSGTMLHFVPEPHCTIMAGIAVVLIAPWWRRRAQK